MPSFLVLYRGENIPEARVVAVSADPTTVAEFADRLLHRPPDTKDPPDPVLLSIERGRRQALRRIAEEAASVAAPGKGVRP